MNDQLPALPDFDHPQLAAVVATLTPEQLDRLTFGVVRLDAEGQVVTFNQAERDNSGIGGRPVIGHHFFTEIAPCLGTPEFLGRIEQALARGTLELELTHIGDFGDQERELRVRVLSAAGGGCWLFAERL